MGKISERTEIACESCGKLRMLSKEEATEDGWLISTKYKGLICPGCTEKYAIHATFIKGPPSRIMKIDNGYVIEYDGVENRTVKQRF